MEIYLEQLEEHVYVRSDPPIQNLLSREKLQLPNNYQVSPSQKTNFRQQPHFKELVHFVRGMNLTVTSR